MTRGNGRSEGMVGDKSRNIVVGTRDTVAGIGKIVGVGISVRES